MQEIKLLHKAIQAAIGAGNEILNVYNTHFEVEIKPDETPVTKADKAASDYIISYLADLEIPVLSEEGEHFSYELRKNWKQMWIADPLDGTKEFVKRNGEFTVNIALIENNKPSIGVIYAPVTQMLYYASNSLGSFKINNHKVIELINTNKISDFDALQSASLKLPIGNLPQEYTVVASRSHLSTELYAHLEELKNRYNTITTINVGSSIKLCLIAEGLAHEYPRFGTTMEWDTAAGQCIIENAGAQLIDLNNNLPMLYNRVELKNNNFIAKR